MQQSLRGDLDWILLRALEKKRGRRYDSPGAFPADVERYLHNDAVKACPPPQVNRLKKFVTRNRALVSAGGAVVASLLAGLGIATYAFLVAEQRRIESELQSAKAQKVAQVLNGMLETADPSHGGSADYPVRDMLNDFVSTLDGRFDNHPQLEAMIRHTIGRAYFHLGIPEMSERQLRRAVELLGEQPQDELLSVRLLTELARTLLFTGTACEQAVARPC